MSDYLSRWLHDRVDIEVSIRWHGSQGPVMGAAVVIESEGVVLWTDGESVSIRAWISCLVPDVVDGGDIVAEPTGTVLLGLAGGTDLCG